MEMLRKINIFQTNMFGNTCFKHSFLKNMYDFTVNKFIYEDEEGRKLHAGGIIFYDINGIWLIKEFYKDSYKLSDPGGKYTFEDCNIYSTICREFCEETYFSFPFSYKELIDLKNENKIEKIFVCMDRNKNPTYLCVLINIENVPNINFDKEIFDKNREKVLSENIHVPQKYYSSFELVYLKYSEINCNIPYFNYRLKQVIQNSFLKDYSKNIISQ